MIGILGTIGVSLIARRVVQKTQAENTRRKEIIRGIKSDIDYLMTSRTTGKKLDECSGWQPIADRIAKQEGKLENHINQTLIRPLEIRISQEQIQKEINNNQFSAAVSFFANLIDTAKKYRLFSRELNAFQQLQAQIGNQSKILLEQRLDSIDAAIKEDRLKSLEEQLTAVSNQINDIQKLSTIMNSSKSFPTISQCEERLSGLSGQLTERKSTLTNRLEPLFSDVSVYLTNPSISQGEKLLRALNQTIETCNNNDLVELSQRFLQSKETVRPFHDELLFLNNQMEDFERDLASGHAGKIFYAIQTIDSRVKNTKSSALSEKWADIHKKAKIGLDAALPLIHGKLDRIQGTLENDLFNDARQFLNDAIRIYEKLDFGTGIAPEHIIDFQPWQNTIDTSEKRYKTLQALEELSGRSRRYIREVAQKAGLDEPTVIAIIKDFVKEKQIIRRSTVFDGRISIERNTVELDEDNGVNFNYQDLSDEKRIDWESSEVITFIDKNLKDVGILRVGENGRLDFVPNIKAETVHIEKANTPSIQSLHDFLVRAKQNQQNLPSTANKWFYIGIIAEKLKWLEQASYFYAAAVWLDPHHNVSWKNLAFLLEQEKRFEESLYCLEQLSGQSDKDVENLIKKLRKKGHNPKEIQFFPYKRQIEQTPGAVEANKTEWGKAESGKVESGKVESGKVESGKVESGKVESGKVESGKVEEPSPIPSVRDEALQQIEDCKKLTEAAYTALKHGNTSFARECCLQAIKICRNWTDPFVETVKNLEKVINNQERELLQKEDHIVADSVVTPEVPDSYESEKVEEPIPLQPIPDEKQQQVADCEKLMEVARTASKNGNYSLARECCLQAIKICEKWDLKSIYLKLQSLMGEIDVQDVKRAYEAEERKQTREEPQVTPTLEEIPKDANLISGTDTTPAPENEREEKMMMDFIAEGNAALASGFLLESLSKYESAVQIAEYIGHQISPELRAKIQEIHDTLESRAEAPKNQESAAQLVEEIRKCPYCSETIKDGKCVFCSAWICPSCGAPNTAIEGKCNRCGKFP